MSKTSIDYEPRGDRVVVRRLARPAPKPGEVVIPNSQQKLLDEGIVVAVGPGLRNRVTWQIDPVDLEVGDHVCFGDYAGSEIKVDGEEYLSMRDEEIHGRRPGHEPRVQVWGEIAADMAVDR
jgi:chaperonin GroES